MKKTGELLKKTREEKGLSIHEIGLSLKINSKILKSIEEGDISHLPAKTFLRGFVQSYAQYLKLNPQEVLKLFSEEMGSTRPEIQLESTDTETKSSTGHAAPVENKFENLTKPSTEKAKYEKKEKYSQPDTKYKNGMVMGIVALLLGFILLTKKIVDRYQKEADVATTAQGVVKEPLPQSDATTTSSEPIQSDVTIPASTGPVHGPEQNPAVTTTTIASNLKDTAKQSSALSSNSSSTVTSSGNSNSTKMTKVDAVVKPTATTTSNQTTTTTLPSKTPTETAKNENLPVVKEKNIELIIEAMDNVDIELQTAQGKTEKIKLGAEQIHRFKTKSGLKVNISNGGAVNIIVNGKDAGVPGVLGQPIKLTY